MSYEIIYGKQFVKLRRTREVIPMLLMGSNNCFDVPDYKHTRGRRARSWGNAPWYNRKGKISEKPDVIVQKLDADLNKYIRNRHSPKEDKPADVRNHFGYFASLAISGRGTRGTSWNAWRSQFTNGIKSALTIEELAKLGVHLYFHGNTSGDQPDNGKPQTVYLETEAQYFDEIKKWLAWKDGNGRYFWLNFSPHDTDEVLRRIREPKRKAPRAKTTVEQDHYFVLTNGYYNLIKYTRRGYRYSLSQSGGRRFMTEKAAETYRQQLLKRGSYKADTWKVRRMEGKATFLV